MTEDPYNSNRGGDKYLLLQSGYQPDQQFSAGNIQNSTAMSPPSPLPCLAFNNNTEEDDLLSVTSKESYHSNKGHHRPSKTQYDFLKFDNDVVNEDGGLHPLTSLAKRRVIEDISRYT